MSIHKFYTRVLGQFSDPALKYLKHTVNSASTIISIFSNLKITHKKIYLLWNTVRWDIFTVVNFSSISPPL